MPITQNRVSSPLSTLFPAASLLACILGVGTLYWPAITGTLHFDDYHNLSQLKEVVDLPSAFEFILSGQTGLFGRPLALASFSLQASAWPDHPEVFLRTNILIHLLNGTLIACLALQLARRLDARERDAAWIAVATSAIWMTIPLQATASLFIVQRMATLSTTFMIVGLIIYLAARRLLPKRPVLAMVGMTAGLCVATLLAVLTKENGALLPVFVLTIELTLLRGGLFKSSPVFRVWGWTFLAVPLFALLVFLVHSLPYPEGLALRRGFTAEQRLWTQGEILWQYLYHAFLPAQQHLVPFHDHLQPSTSLIRSATLLAAAAWGGIIFLAFRLRAQYPVFAFAVVWFLAAHLMESTTIGLELYFAHRNYLALFGPALALAWGAILCKGAQAGIAKICLLAYIAVLSGSLYVFTSLWGQPALAAEMWGIYRPESVRVSQYLASQLQRNGYHHAALRVLDESHARTPVQTPSVAANALQLSCALSPHTDHGARLSSLADLLPVAHFSYPTPRVLFDLYRQNRVEPCAGLTSSGIRELAETLLENDAYRRNRNTRYNLHMLLAEIAIDDRNFGRSMTHIEHALKASANFDALELALRILADGNRLDLADGVIEIMRSQLPPNPLLRDKWERRIRAYEYELGRNLDDNKS